MLGEVERKTYQYSINSWLLEQNSYIYKQRQRNETDISEIGFSQFARCIIKHLSILCKETTEKCPNNMLVIG